jgi:hypothetical protein
MMQAPQPKLDQFEGLVFTTARMFASYVAVLMEEEELRQELRIVVWRSCCKFDAERSGKTGAGLRAYVYGNIANRVKSLRRDAARRARYNVSFEHIEGHRVEGDERFYGDFELRYLCESPDVVYGKIDEGLLVLPATVTPSEVDVLLLLMFGFSETEMMLKLTLKRGDLRAVVGRLQVKFADWSRSPSSASVRPVALCAAA